jgi:hypothetical protein
MPGIRRVALVSCVKAKRPEATPAGDLYTSHLFRGLKEFAKAHADAWFILSAEHGLLDPRETVQPYEKTLNAMGRAERLAWAERVKRQLVDRLPPDVEVVVLAGERYRADLVPFLRARGHLVTIPLEGLPIGRQLQWLKRNTGSPDAR